MRLAALLSLTGMALPLVLHLEASSSDALTIARKLDELGLGHIAAVFVDFSDYFGGDYQHSFFGHYVLLVW